MKCLAFRSDTLVQRQEPQAECGCRTRSPRPHRPILAQKKALASAPVAAGAFGFPCDADPKFRAAGQG